MKPTEEDWSLLHSRARKIESSQTLTDALYWCDMTSKQVEFIKEKLQQPGTQEVKRTKVF